MKTLFLLFLTIVGACGYDCSTLELEEDVDWSTMKGTWFDTMNIPALLEPVQCYDWTNITAVDDGFTTVIQQRIVGHPYSEFDLHFVRKRQGVYEWDKKWIGSYKKSTRKVLAHMGKKEREAFVKQSSKIFLEREYVFLTDTQTYFATVMCTPKGWESWITQPDAVPATAGVANAWNALSSRGVSGPVVMNSRCQPMVYE